MNYIWKYNTPEVFDDLFLSSDGEVLTGLWFEGSRDQSKHRLDGQEKLLPVFQDCCAWLDGYFAGMPADRLPAYKIRNLTPFRRDVLGILLTIPFGETRTYGEIAQLMAKRRGISRMSAQAVGGAVGWNPLGILIPCHRVVGTDGSLTGYGGGIENKRQLLLFEQQKKRLAKEGNSI